jgi:hypothetical protein
VGSLLSFVAVEAETIERRDPNFQYGRTQAVVALVVLAGSLIATVFCLVIQQRLRRGGGLHLTRAVVTFQAGIDDGESDGLLTNEYNNYDDDVDGVIEGIVRTRRARKEREGLKENGSLLGPPLEGKFFPVDVDTWMSNHPRPPIS